MRSIVLFLRTCVRLLVVAVCGALLSVLRFILQTPQALTSSLPGEAQFYTWTYGKIFYMVSGSPTARPLVLLHAPEIGGSGFELRFLVEALSQQYRVYVPDLPGFGLSQRPALPYTAATYQTFLRAFLQDVVAQPAALVGSGLSGKYCVELASRTPELCERVVLLSPPALTARVSPSGTLTSLLLWPPLRLFVYSLLTARPLLRARIAWQHAGSVDRAELNQRYAAAHQQGAEYAAIAWLAGLLDLDISTLLPHLSRPVLLLQGTNDLPGIQQAVLPTEIKRIEIQGASRRVHEERPEQVLPYLLSGQVSSPAKENMPLTTSDSVQPSSTSFVLDDIVIEGAEKPAEAAPSAAETLANHVEGPEREEKHASVEDTAAQTREAKEEETVEAYCVKCRQRRTMLNPQRITTKNGRSALEGVCPVCGTKLFRFVSSQV